MGRSSKFRISKLERLLKDDDLPRLKVYIKKHHVDVNVPRLGNDWTMLHWACHLGYEACMRYLLKKGADPLLCDQNGDLPLHLAATSAKTGGKQYLYTDIILPLIKNSPTSLDQPNKRHITPRQLLEGIKQHLRWQQERKHFEPRAGVDDEKDWNEKLFFEMNEDMGDMGGNYEQDYYTEYQEEPSSFQGWSERLGREKYHRDRQRYAQDNSRRRKNSDTDDTTNPKRPKINEEKQKRFQENLQRDHEAYMKLRSTKRKEKLKDKKREYEQKCANIFGTSCTKELVYSDLPWPELHSKLEKGLEILFCDLEPKTAQYKKYLRDQQIRWHPDKFLQKCGHKLKESEKEHILNKVKEISQALNGISK